MNNFLQDLRYGFRTLLKNPGFTAVAALTLALGIGANTAIFSIVNAYMFRSLPVKNAHELVEVGVRDHHVELAHSTSFANYEDVRDHAGIFSDAIAYQNSVVGMSVEGQAERTWVELVSGNYFSMLGVEAALGRTFLADECRSPGTSPVMILSYGFWQSRFGGDPSVIGKPVKLNGHPFTIVGVAPESFPGTETFLSLDAYVPIMMKGQLYPGADDSFTERGWEGIRIMGRLKQGVTLDQANAALNVLSNQLEQQYPDDNKNIRLIAVPESKAKPTIDVAEFMPTLAFSFMALVGLVLLIACANVANLILARATTRRKEMAIRAALGAGHARLIRQLLTESILLAAMGAVAGLLLALWAVDLLSAIRLSADAPIQFDLSPDWRVFAFTMFAALLTGVIAGLIPAFQASRIDLNEALKEGGRTGASSGRHRFRSALVVLQVAASLLLLICAGLFIRSLQNAQNIDLGFRSDNLLMFSVDVDLQNYDEERGKRFYKQVIERAEALPQVRSASVASHVPLGYNNSSADIFLPERASTTDEDVTAVFFSRIAPRYLQTLGIPLLEGREFTERDDESAPKVAIINEAMARRFWPGERAMGKQFQIERDGPAFEVIGVVKTGKYLMIGEAPRPFVYLPLAQRYYAEMTFYLHTEGDPTSIAASVRQIARDLDKDLPVYDVKTMSEHLHNGLAFLFVRLGAMMVGAFGMVGLTLAMVGIYGVISYSVSQRRHEIAIRMALGANRGKVLKMIIGHGMLLTAIGVAAGLLAAFAVTRFMSGMLYDVSATDPLTFIGIPLLLASVAMLASYIPAHRATRVDPMVALRYE